MTLPAPKYHMWQEFGVFLYLPQWFLTTYPAPDSNSVFVDEAHFDELPKTQKQLKSVKTHELGDAEWHFLSKSPDTNQPEPVLLGLSGRHWLDESRLSLFLLGCCYLIFHLIGSQTFVDGVH